MKAAEIRKIYEPFWKAQKHPVSDAALEVLSRMSEASISGFEGADFIAFGPLLSEQMDEARAAVWDKAIGELKQLWSTSKAAAFNAAINAAISHLEAAKRKAQQ